MKNIRQLGGALGPKEPVRVLFFAWKGGDGLKQNKAHGEH
jgi:hypothetical protein